jgi:uncharacterized protein YndB with AHSA1/START domain
VLVEATPDAVYAALADPAARAAWLPPSGMTGTFEHFDLRVGGGYRMTLRYDDPTASTGKTDAGTDVVEATFTAVVPRERIVEAVEFDSTDPAVDGTMTMTWTLEPSGAGTVVTIRADDVPPGIDAADHEVGLRSSLDQLAAYVLG